MTCSQKSLHGAAAINVVELAVPFVATCDKAFFDLKLRLKSVDWRLQPVSFLAVGAKNQYWTTLLFWGRWKNLREEPHLHSDY